MSNKKKLLRGFSEQKNWKLKIIQKYNSTSISCYPIVLLASWFIIIELIVNILFFDDSLFFDPSVFYQTRSVFFFNFILILLLEERNTVHDKV